MKISKSIAALSLALISLLLLAQQSKAQLNCTNIPNFNKLKDYLRKDGGNEGNQTNNEIDVVKKINATKAQPGALGWCHNLIQPNNTCCTMNILNQIKNTIKKTIDKITTFRPLIFFLIERYEKLADKCSLAWNKTKIQEEIKSLENQGLTDAPAPPPTLLRILQQNNNTNPPATGANNKPPANDGNQPPKKPDERKGALSFLRLKLLQCQADIATAQMRFIKGTACSICIDPANVTDFFNTADPSNPKLKVAKEAYDRYLRSIGRAMNCTDYITKLFRRLLEQGQAFDATKGQCRSIGNKLQQLLSDPANQPCKGATNCTEGCKSTVTMFGDGCSSNLNNSDNQDIDTGGLRRSMNSFSSQKFERVLQQQSSDIESTATGGISAYVIDGQEESTLTVGGVYSNGSYSAEPTPNNSNIDVKKPLSASQLFYSCMISIIIIMLAL